MRNAFALLSPAVLLAAGCFDYHEDTRHRGPELVEVARFDDQPTGVAAAPDGRLFVCFPYMFREPRDPVVEVRPDGKRRPYPDEAWNRWDGAEGASASKAFVCAQSVYVDPGGRALWILDPASPNLQGGVVPGGPKLVKVDLATDKVVQTILFDDKVAPEDSYLNDVRVDPVAGYAYITDSTLGALVVVDLKNGGAFRRLERHPATKSENITPQIGGHGWRAFGYSPEVHVDGLALDPKGHWLYFQALTARTLYRVPTTALRNPAVDEKALARVVDVLGETSAVDGIDCDRAGDLYLTALEHDAIQRFGVVTRKIETVVQDARISWPDSVAFGPGKRLYFAASQIHRNRVFNWGSDRRDLPYKVYAITLP
jgi:sugar lactone lactonase YvrE